MVVRFVCVVRVPLCVRVSRVSRVCPGSPRCLFTGYRVFRVSRVCPGSPRCLFTGYRTGRPRGAVGFGLAAVESAAASVVALTCGVFVVGGFGWL